MHTLIVTFECPDQTSLELLKGELAYLIQDLHDQDTGSMDGVDHRFELDGEDIT